MTSLKEAVNAWNIKYDNRGFHKPDVWADGYIKELEELLKKEECIGEPGDNLEIGYDLAVKKMLGFLKGEPA